MRSKGALGVTTVESAVYGMPSIAALSRQLHSPDLSGPSLSCLTSLLKPGPPPKKKHPLPRTGLSPRPLCSAGISATFHPRPCPRLPLSFSPPPFDTYIHTRGPYCLWGHTPNIRVEKKKSSERQEKKYRPDVEKLCPNT